MAKRARLTCTPQFKVEVVLAFLSGRQMMAEIFRQQSLKPDLVSLWMTTVLSKLRSIFEGPLDDGGVLARVAGSNGLLTQDGILRRKQASVLLLSPYGNAVRS